MSRGLVIQERTDEFCDRDAAAGLPGAGPETNRRKGEGNE